MSAWEAPRVSDVLRDAGDDRPQNHGRRVPCPACGTARNAVELLVVAGLPHDLTGGVYAACGTCWSRWRREMGEEAFVAALGAPQEIMARVRGRR